MGPAPTAPWRVHPIPPLQLEEPSLKPQPFPPLPPSSPTPLTLLTLFATLREGAVEAGVGEAP